MWSLILPSRYHGAHGIRAYEGLDIVVLGSVVVHVGIRARGGRCSINDHTRIRAPRARHWAFPLAVHSEPGEGDVV